jgi:hypothetical protein
MVLGINLVHKVWVTRYGLYLAFSCLQIQYKGVNLEKKTTLKKVLCYEDVVSHLLKGAGLDELTTNSLEDHFVYTNPVPLEDKENVSWASGNGCRVILSLFTSLWRPRDRKFCSSKSFQLKSGAYKANRLSVRVGATPHRICGRILALSVRCRKQGLIFFNLQTGEPYIRSGMGLTTLRYLGTFVH